MSVYYLSKHIWNVALVQRDTICLWVSAAVTSHKFKAVNFSCKDQRAEDLIHSLVQFERIPRDQHKEANWEQWRVCFCSYTFDKWRVCISGNGKGFFQSDVCLSSKRDNTVPFTPSRPLVSCTSHFSDNSHTSHPRADCDFSVFICDSSHILHLTQPWCLNEMTDSKHKEDWRFDLRGTVYKV